MKKIFIALLSTILILTACSDEPMETETEKEIKVLFDVRYPA